MVRLDTEDGSTLLLLVGVVLVESFLCSLGFGRRVPSPRDVAVVAAARDAL